MADDTATPETGAEQETTPTAPETGAETPDNDRLPDDHPVVRALKKANEEAAAARLKVKEYEDATKSEAEKQADALATAQAERDAARTEAARLRAAVAHGLSDDDLDLLGNGTPDEIEERASKLAARFAAAGKPRKPAPDVAQGRTDTSPLSTAAQFAAAVESQLR